jgi:hypothetical protein
MLTDKKSADARANSSANLLNQLGISHNCVESKEGNVVVLPLHRGGRKPGVPNVPTNVKEMLGQLAHDTSVKDVSASFEVSTASVNNYKDRPEVLDRVHNRAVDRLLSSLGLLTDDKMDKLGAVDLSTVADKMSRVVERTGTRTSEGTTARLVLYAPRVKEEKEFETIEGQVIE